MLKTWGFKIFFIGVFLLTVRTVAASDFSFYMWDQTVSGKAFGQDSSIPGVITKVDATLEKDRNNEKGFRLVSTFIGGPTEFGYTTISNATALNADGSFYFNGKEYDFTQPLNYKQSSKMYEFFPRIPLFSTGPIGLNLLIGIKALDIQAQVSGTDGTANPITEEIDEFIPVPQIGVRCFLGNIKKGLRVELMVKYIKGELSGTAVDVLDLEAVAYVKGKGGMDFFVGWKSMDLEVILDEDTAQEAGVELKNSGIMYGGRIRF